MTSLLTNKEDKRNLFFVLILIPKQYSLEENNYKTIPNSNVKLSGYLFYIKVISNP